MAAVLWSLGLTAASCHSWATPPEAKLLSWSVIVVVANHGDQEAEEVADHVFWVPKVDELLSPIVNVIPLQLLAYHIADIDGKGYPDR